MRNHHNKTGVCFITKKHLPLRDLVQGSTIRKNIVDLIKADYPDFEEQDYVSVRELNKYRKRYLEQVMKSEVGEITQLEAEVINSIHENELLSSNIEAALEEDLKLGERIADKVATFGGSWAFIIFFFSFILLWMAVNVYVLANRSFDPYPFILLNLILSCLAAIQAPIIMMSQNRKEAKDRQRSMHDYKVNLKAELEIRLLHEKIDYLIVQQNQRLVEIQEIQVDLMEDILNRIKK